MPIPQYAVILRSNSALDRLHRLLLDDGLKFHFFNLLNSDALRYSPSTWDVAITIDEGVSAYRLKPIVADSIWRAVHQLREFVLASGNNFTPNDSRVLPLPDTIPYDLLTSSDISVPYIAHIPLNSTSNPLYSTFYSFDELWARVRLIQDFLEFTIHWLCDALERSIKGLGGRLWNFGAYFGYTREEFEEKAGYFKSLSTDHQEIAVNNERALILHPTESTMARTFLRNGKLVLRYKKRQPTLPTIPEENDIDILPHVLAAVSINDKVA
ncbi:hypothetical protein BDZ97DRAFT_2069710 [Flammula alnicola]|nr:hypothetical protein BDZ97DRAFT_2069710 [Flammula alnicola]